MTREKYVTETTGENCDLMRSVEVNFELYFIDK